MTTRLERARETLKREERRADQKRLMEAKDHLLAAIEFLKAPLHDQDFENYLRDIRPPIAEYTEQLKHVIEKQW